MKRFSRPSSCPRWARCYTIQLPYLNTLASIWEYKELFETGRINFFASMGPICPLCHRPDCYQPIPPYWRYAQELFPAFKKERIPVARFLCRLKRRTFSLLPIQLAPYCQYTLTAIVGALLLGLGERKQGQQGFQGAVLAVDPDSLVTPWLVACWLMLVLSGLKRAHAWLQRWYDLSRIRTAQPGKAWEEVLSYFLALDWKSSGPRLIEVLHRYSRTTRQFLFGIPSQQRLGGKLSR